MRQTINVAAEDQLGLAALFRILEIECSNFDIAVVLPKARMAGNSPIRASVEKFQCAAQRGQRFVVLTDLDNVACPSKLMGQWGVIPVPNRFLFRIAVRETEAWLLADRRNFAKFLSIQTNLINAYPEQLEDPKHELLGLARKGSKKIQRELLPEKGVFAKVGHGYNDLLCSFVQTQWDYEQAAKHAPSLERFLARLRQTNFS